MIALHVVLYILALVCFGAAALAVPSRFNLTALGLALWVLTLIVP